ncbi:MAG: ABC transporter permease [Micromonosporaceae bacterium]|nr:ABC transporter permease [Micromonosporaceae bacterium]
MLRTVLANLRAHVGRLAATTLAVVFGVAFVVGTVVFADTARQGYADAYARSAINVDVSVLPADTGETPALLPAASLAAVRRLPDVAAADGRMVARLALLNRDGRPVTNLGRVGYGIAVDGDARLRPYDVDGRTPGPGEALLDTDSAERLGYRVGDTIVVVDPEGVRHRFAVVGLLDFGVDQRFSGQSVVGLPAAVLATLTGVDGYEELAIEAREGVDPDRLAAAVSAQLGPGVQVVTGEQRRSALIAEAARWLDGFRVFLLLFGVVALVVAAFVIYNTFAVLAAMRVRQTALLRCLGAKRGQIFRATLLEAAIVGLVGGAAGILLGIGVAFGLVALLVGQLDVDLAVGAAVVGPAPVVAGLVLGLAVTVVSAVVPAVRATRTSPLAALRDQPTGPTGRRRRVLRAVLAGLVGVVGIAATILGVGESDPNTGAVLIVLGGVVTFLAVLVASPLFIGALCTVIGAVPARLFGTPARLATANARANPGRTAITTATLMIGIGLMSVFSVVLSSLSTTAARQIAGQFPVDVIATGLRYGDIDPALPAGYADALRARPEFSAVAQVRAVSATVDGTEVRVGAVDPGSLGALVTPSISEGTLAELRPGTAIVATSRTRLGATPVGATLSVVGSQSTLDVRIAASAVALAPGAANLDLLVVWSDLESLAGDAPDIAVLAKTAPGVSAAQSLAALDELADEFPLVSAGSVADLRSDLESTVNGILAVVAGLLAITVVISLFGIANTLALSVVERTRESATIRALGLTRGQLRATLILEALVMAAVGALVGLTYGLVYGAILSGKALAGWDPVVVVPWAWFAGIVVLVAVTAALAAVLPARRAARASIVAALVDT